MQKEFGKHIKQNKTTAKSVRHGIANSITDKEVEVGQFEAQALFVAELANSMQEQSQKQFKEMMEMFKAKLTQRPHLQEAEEEVSTLRDGGVSQARGMLRTRSQRFQAPCGMEKQEEHLKVRGGQVHRAVATRRG